MPGHAGDTVQQRDRRTLFHSDDPQFVSVTVFARQELETRRIALGLEAVAPNAGSVARRCADLAARAP
jgi:hypothetical protein